MRALPVFCCATFLGLALLLCAPSVLALSYVMMSDEDLFDQADGVVKARVLTELQARDGDAQTRYVLQIERVLAGGPLPEKPVLRLPGTFTAPTRNAVVPGVPRLIPGSSIVLFYSKSEEKWLQAIHLSLGLFGLQKSPQGELYTRSLEGSFDRGDHSFNERYRSPRHAGRFENWLADRGEGQQRTIDYLLTEKEISASSKFTFTEFAFATPGPGRWFQFDSNQSLPWTAHPGGQANTSFDEFASLQTALAAWTNDAGSRILLNYAGTLNFSGNQAGSSFCGGDGAPACFSGHVLWNDPNNAVSGTFLCNSGGILGIGGSSVTSNGLMFNGQLWYPRLEAFVIVNDGAGCSMDGFNGANGAELLAHEVGHTLAFGHSCGDSLSPSCGSNATLNAAVMRASLHSDGRGAALGVDDQAGAVIAYPNPAGSNVGPQFAAASPASGSTTNMGGGTIGAQLSRNITFTVSGGSGTGTTQLTCSVGSGSVVVASGSPQTVAVGGSANAVVARFTLTASAQTGVINCSAVRQGATPNNFSYTFTANAGTPASPNRIFCSGFEPGQTGVCGS